MGAGLVLILAIIGIGLFLLFEHALIFWFIALPLFLIIVGSILYWIFN